MFRKNINPFSFLDEFFENDMFRSNTSFWFSSIGTFGENNMNFPADGDKNYHKTEEISETESHTIKREIWTSIDGTQRFERTSKSSKVKPKAVESKEDLKLLLDKAVEEQDFEKAIILRDKIAKSKNQTS